MMLRPTAVAMVCETGKATINSPTTDPAYTKFNSLHQRLEETKSPIFQGTTLLRSLWTKGCSRIGCIDSSVEGEWKHRGPECAPDWDPRSTSLREWREKISSLRTDNRIFTGGSDESNHELSCQECFSGSQTDRHAEHLEMQKKNGKTCEQEAKIDKGEEIDPSGFIYQPIEFGESCESI